MVQPEHFVGLELPHLLACPSLVFRSSFRTQRWPSCLESFRSVVRCDDFVRIAHFKGKCDMRHVKLVKCENDANRMPYGNEGRRAALLRAKRSHRLKNIRVGGKPLKSDIVLRNNYNRQSTLTFNGAPSASTLCESYKSLLRSRCPSRGYLNHSVYDNQSKHNTVHHPTRNTTSFTSLNQRSDQDPSTPFTNHCVCSLPHPGSTSLGVSFVCTTTLGTTE